MDNLTPEIENNLKAVMNLDYKIRDLDHVNYELNKLLFSNIYLFNSEKFAVINLLVDELSNKINEYFKVVLVTIKEQLKND